MYLKSRLAFCALLVTLFGVVAVAPVGVVYAGEIGSGVQGKSCIMGTSKSSLTHHPGSANSPMTIALKCFVNSTGAGGNSLITALSTMPASGTVTDFPVGGAQPYTVNGGGAWSSCYSCFSSRTMTFTRGQMRNHSGTAVGTPIDSSLPDNYFELRLTASSGLNLSGYTYFSWAGNLSGSGFSLDLYSSPYNNCQTVSDSQACQAVGPASGRPTTHYVPAFADIADGGSGQALWEAAAPDHFLPGGGFLEEACEGWTATFDPATEEYLSPGSTQSVTLTRSSDHAATFPLAGYAWGYNWAYGLDEAATMWDELYGYTPPTPIDPAVTSETSITISTTAWAERTNAYFNVVCAYQHSPGVVEVYRYRLSDPAPIEGSGVQRACAWLSGTFPARSTDTSESFRVRLAYTVPTDQTVAVGGVTALKVGRELEDDGVWTDVTVSDYEDLDLATMGSPLPLEATEPAFYAVTDLVGTALEDGRGRWSVVCVDSVGAMRIRQPDTATNYVPRTGTDATGNQIDTVPGTGTPIEMPGGGDTGATGQLPSGSGSEVDNDFDGDGVNDDSEGIGYGGGNCQAGWGKNPTTWGPALVKTIRCMLVGLFVPNPDRIGQEFDSLVVELETQFPFSLMFLMVDFAEKLGNEMESASGTGCFDMPGSFSFGSFSTSVSDVCIGDDITVSAGQRQLLAALMIAPLLWGLCAHAVRMVRGV